MKTNNTMNKRPRKWWGGRMVASSFKSRRGFLSKACQSSMKMNCKELCSLKRPKQINLLTKKTNRRKKKTAELCRNNSTQNSKIRLWIDKMKMNTIKKIIIKSIQKSKKTKTQLITLIRATSTIISAKNAHLLENKPIKMNNRLIISALYFKVRELTNLTANKI